MGGERVRREGESKAATEWMLSHLILSHLGVDIIRGGENQPARRYVSGVAL